MKALKLALEFSVSNAGAPVNKDDSKEDGNDKKIDDDAGNEDIIEDEAGAEGRGEEMESNSDEGEENEDEGVNDRNSEDASDDMDSESAEDVPPPKKPLPQTSTLSSVASKGKKGPIL